ncbi:phage portal protein [Sinorhizobium meliloti]|nr:phage portal protein [Sinorhizobium meliloti]
MFIIPGEGQQRTLSPSEVLHVFADSDDGICGTSIVKAAADAISLARDTGKAQARLFKNGMIVGGALIHPHKIGPEALQQIRESMEARYQGAENAHRWMILEERHGAETGFERRKNSQQIETRELQVEEIGGHSVCHGHSWVWTTRVGAAGSTSSARSFVRYALNPWFVAWEQAVKRSCMDDADKDRLDCKFNAGALLRGSMKDQGNSLRRRWARAVISRGWSTPRSAMDGPSGTHDRAKPAFSEKGQWPMSLRKLPEISSFKIPDVCAFVPDERALDDWNAGIMAAQTSENTISMLEVIGRDWWTGGGVTSKRVGAALRSIG